MRNLFFAIAITLVTTFPASAHDGPGLVKSDCDALKNGSQLEIQYLPVSIKPARKYIDTSVDPLPVAAACEIPSEESGFIIALAGNPVFANENDIRKLFSFIQKQTKGTLMTTMTPMPVKAGGCACAGAAARDLPVKYILRWPGQPAFNSLADMKEFLEVLSHYEFRFHNRK